jgi:cell wall-associated NlpC family hydrolase
MKSILRAAPVVLIVALVVPVVTPTYAAATPVDEQRQRVEDIVDELERLEQKATELGADYVEAVDSKTLLDVEITDAEESVAEKEAELETLRANLGEMALRSFVGSGSSPLGPLFEDSENLNDVLQREELARVALSAGDVSTDELDALVSDLDEERSDLEGKREEANQLAQYLQNQQGDTEQRTEEYKQARAEAEAELGRLIVEEEERRAQESAQRIVAELAAAQATAASSNSGSGTPAANSGTSSSSNSNSSSSSSTSRSTSSSSSNSGSSAAAAPAPAPAPAAPSAPAVSSLAGAAVSAALSQRGVPYRYAAATPGVAFDCSGLTSYAWGAAGVYLPHQSRAQYASVPHVPISSAQPGDLLFYYTPISHVGIYLGGGQIVHAPNTGSVVNVATVNWGKVYGVGRPG